MNIKKIEADYRDFVKMKKSNPELANAITLYTQQMLATRKDTSSV